MHGSRPADDDAALSPYPSPRARDERLQAFTQVAGGELIRYGESVQGRSLLAARLPCRDTSRAPPRVLVTGGIHGIEYLSCALALGLVERAGTADAVFASLRARAELWVIPCLNPDGYARVWEARGQGKLAHLRANAHGVDLNRNFPLPVGARRRRLPGAGSTVPGHATYVGPQPLSEPESAALDRLMRDQGFLAAVNGHTFLGRLIPARTTTRAEFRRYGELCARFAGAQKDVRYPRLASRFFDTFTGELEDYQHHTHGAWAVCLESFSIWHSLRQHLRAPSLFWRFNPRDPDRWIENDLPGIAAFLLMAIESPVRRESRSV